MDTKIDIEKDKNNIALDTTEKKYTVEGKEFYAWEKEAIESRPPTEISLDEQLFFLYQYDSYEDYKKFQTFGNKEKLHMQSAKKVSIKALSKYVYNHVSDLKFGLCHGTRRGNEQKWFKEYISLAQYQMIDALGTEISDTATQFPNTIQWDFHNVKNEWINNTCFIYSNSLDHSYDPAECLKQWMSCLKEGGLCIIEWSPNSTYASKIDPFAASFVNYIKLVLRRGFYIKNLLWVDEINLIQKGAEVKTFDMEMTTKMYIVITSDENESIVYEVDNEIQIKQAAWQHYDHALGAWVSGPGAGHLPGKMTLLKEHVIQNIDDYAEGAILTYI
mgnify:CR=1 FL=1